MKDNPLHRIEIREMTVPQLDLFLEGIREQRLAPLRIYKEAQALKKRLLDERLIAKLDKHIKMMGKEIEAFDKVLAKLEKRVINIKAIKVEIDDRDLAPPTEGEEDEASGLGEPVP